jgi:hypothetical protein
MSHLDDCNCKPGQPGCEEFVPVPKPQPGRDFCEWCNSLHEIGRHVGEARRRRSKVVFGTFDVACDDGFTADSLGTLREAQAAARKHLLEGCADNAVSIVQGGWRRA